MESAQRQLQIAYAICFEHEVTLLRTVKDESHNDKDRSWAPGALLAT